MLALTDKASYLIRLLNRWLLQHKPDLPLPYTTLTPNTDYSGCPHRDPNEGPTYMAAFGNFTGGELK
eukprot:1511588-Prorocentrum_lima.AAC.1